MAEQDGENSKYLAKKSISTVWLSLTLFTTPHIENIHNEFFKNPSALP
jgi:hypothetical protein